MKTCKRRKEHNALVLQIKLHYRRNSNYRQTSKISGKRRREGGGGRDIFLSCLGYIS